MILSQNGNQRDEGRNEWSFTKYDNLDRPVVSGIYRGGTQDSHRIALENQTIYGESRGNVVHGYTNQCYPRVSNESDVLNVTYYDDYDWLPENSAYAFSLTDTLGCIYSSAVVGQSTGSKSKVLGIDEDLWMTSVVYYDNQYRTIQSISDLYPGGTEIVSNKHNFLGEVIQTKVKQVVESQTYEYNKWFDFDNQGRLLAIRQKITGDDENGAVTISSYQYDDLGQLVQKGIHNGSDITDYTYRLAGTQEAVSSPSFSYRLGFDRPAADGLSSRADGNLANVIWGTGGQASQGYQLSYDKLGQLHNATLTENSSGQWNSSAKFNEGNITYDANGNIKSIHRTDATGETLHNIAYNYDGNQLLSVDFNGTTSEPYRYDANGNMIFDGVKNICISYNHLNLPEKIFAGSDTIRYIYTGSGDKLATVASGSSTYYRSVMTYAKGNGYQHEELLHIMQPEGLIVKSGISWTYKYFKTDYLGNTRVLLSALNTADGVVMTPEQSTDYYPFGLAHEYNNLHQNRYLYSGKELQDASVGTNGLLGLYDFGSRYYDPVLGRWFNIDPALQLANPYLYCGNNPMMFTDPNGEFFFSLAVLNAICWGATIGAATYTASVAMSPGGFNNWNWGNFGMSVGMGALSGAATYGVGEAFGSVGTFGNELSRGVTHGMIQGGISELGGGDFLTGFASGAIGSWAGSGAEALGITGTTAGKLTFGAVSGGIGSELTGGNFLQGAASGLMVAGLNHLQHNGEQRTQKIIEKYNKLIASINDPVDIAIAVANVFSKDEIAILVKAGKFTNIVSYGTTGISAYQTIDAFVQGKPWGENAVNTTIGAVGCMGLPGLIIAPVLNSYKQAFNYISNGINYWNQNGTQFFKNEYLIY